MIRVLDGQRSLAFYEKAFGLTVAERLAFEGFTLVYLSNGESEFELELTINHGRTEPYGIGDGYGHVAFSVDDLEAEHARFEALGLNPTSLKELSCEGKPPAWFFFVQDPDGYKIEVVQRGGRYR
jgi:lactoylglutathione lyase